MMERLTDLQKYCEKIDCGAYGSGCDCYEKAVYEKLREYEELEEQGLLLKLPVKCGQWVYSAECGNVVPYIVASYTSDRHGLWCLNLHGGLIGLWGRSVFLTKAEAEKALEEMKGE